nr:MAG TPA: hypothetical protein [Caudoviricetes sp.]
MLLYRSRTSRQRRPELALVTLAPFQLGNGCGDEGIQRGVQSQRFGRHHGPHRFRFLADNRQGHVDLLRAHGRAGCTSSQHNCDSQT